MFGKPERILICAIAVLIGLYAIGKPLCVACFFEQPPVATLPLGEATIEARVVAPPERSEKNQRVLVDHEGGRILLYLSRYSDVGYGDTLEIEGIFQAPEAFEDFDYPAWLAGQGIYQVSFYPHVTVIAKSGEFSLPPFLSSLRSRLSLPVLSHIPEPQASLVLAMTLGERAGITEDFRGQLSRAGIFHIAAISGLHVSLIGLGLVGLFVLLGLRRPLASFATIPVLAFYVFLVGAPASALRAGIMASFFLLAFAFGRIGKLFYVLLLTAFLLLLFDISFLEDIGFQLSFGALLSLTLLAPLLWRVVSSYTQNNLVLIFVSSLSIALVLSPLLLIHFGEVSLLAPLANVLVLPVVPFLMAFAFIVELFGILWQPLWLLSSYVVFVSRIFGSIAPLSVSLPVVALAPYYVVLFALAYYVAYHSPFVLRREMLRSQHS